MRPRSVEERRGQDMGGRAATSIWFGWRHDDLYLVGVAARQPLSSWSGHTSTPDQDKGGCAATPPFEAGCLATSIFC